MPKKIRELRAALAKAGFKKDKSSGGSHTKWKHPNRQEPVVLSGNDGADAKRYQEKDVDQALKDVGAK
jgi:predicted RNA binding protein YcfA (HicA-like mRNA interferase family)